jgi:Alkyl sulfatase C-terminal
MGGRPVHSDSRVRHRYWIEDCRLPARSERLEPASTRALPTTRRRVFVARSPLPLFAEAVAQTSGEATCARVRLLRNRGQRTAAEYDSVPRLGETTLDDEAKEGEITIEPDTGPLDQLLSLLDTFEGWFNIVEP